VARDADDPLNACLQFMFPNGSPPRLASFDRSAEMSWLTLPNPRAPRMLVPTTPARAAGRAVVRISASLNRQERAVRRLAGGVMSFGAGAAYPGRLVLDRVGDGSILEYLAEKLGQEVTVAISVGRARANLKPVLAVFSSTGQPLAFVKLGFPAAAMPHVQRETQSFEVLATRSFVRLGVPRLLFSDTWRGSPVLATSPLTEPARRVNRARSRLPLSAMAELANAFAKPATALADVAGWQRLRNQAQAGPTSEAFATAVEELHRRHGDHVVRPTAWHGDWTPWNMSWGRDRITLWDWERFERDVPAGLDALHYAVASLSEHHGYSRQSIERGLEWVGRHTLSQSPHHQVLCQLYLAFLVGRHLQATGEFSPIADTLGTTTLEVLHSMMSQRSVA
jgi:hypothetical protein